MSLYPNDSLADSPSEEGQEVDEARCYDCDGVFQLDEEEDPESCPLCGTEFDA